VRATGWLKLTLSVPWTEICMTFGPGGRRSPIIIEIVLTERLFKA